MRSRTLTLASRFRASVEASRVVRAAAGDDAGWPMLSDRAAL